MPFTFQNHLLRTILKVSQDRMNSKFALFLLAATTAACDAPAQQKAVAADAPTTSTISMPHNGGLIPGTPEGDLADWVKDIRKGIADVPALTKTNPAEAQKKALDLYVTRQEYAEMYYGVDGRNKASVELSEAIETAEERFHVVMQLLAQKAPAYDAVDTAVNALDEQQALVAKLWKKTGVKLNRAAR
jgi:hypothetical protein